MALIISECSRLSVVGQICVPPHVEQEVAIGAGSTQSAPISSGTKYVRLVASDACHVAFGVDPTATTAKFPLAANAAEWVEVNPGSKIAVIAA